MIKLTRRRLLHLTAGPVALPITSRIAMAQDNPSPPLPAARERPLAERLAAYAQALRYDDLDAATVERVKVHVIDTIGCGIGAFEERAVGICREVALAVPGTAAVIGTRRRTTPDLAAFANGAAFRFLDFNDTYVGRFAVHPSDTIAACLAVAEAERASAQDLIAAIALAYEVNCRLVDSLDIATRGWDPPVLGLPAVALAAGKLMKLDPERLTHAVSLAINDHIPMAQTRVQTLSDWKGLAAAEAARNAVFAALLARGGVTGPSPIFEGRSGFFKQVSGPANVDVDSFGRRGVPFRIHECSLKAYPVFDGDVTNESFAPHMYRDPRILAFMQKIKVSEDPILTAKVGGAVPTRVTAILLDGQRISRELDHAPGFAARPMNRDEVERKFRGNVGKRWEKDRTDRILQKLWALDRTDDVPSLLGELALPT